MGTRVGAKVGTTTGGGGDDGGVNFSGDGGSYFVSRIHSAASTRT